MTRSEIATTGGRSAVVVTVPLHGRLRRLRERHDPSAQLGVPPHVTLLFPFVPASGLTGGVRNGVAQVAAAHDPFVVTLASAATFPGAVYLVPEPSAPFISLTAALLARFPAYPPYGGDIAVDGLIPHLTMATDVGVEAAALAREMASALPVHGAARSLTVIAEDGTGRWSLCWRLRLGVPP